jgi:acyl dehydratase
VSDPSKSLAVGSTCSISIRFTEEQAHACAALSGDWNPIHFDKDAAAACPIGRLSIPGMLGPMVFSRILGTMLPGPGTVSLRHSLEFRNPMFVDTDYTATVTIIDMSTSLHIATLSTVLIDSLTKNITLRGTAIVMNIAIR